MHRVRLCLAGHRDKRSRKSNGEETRANLVRDRVVEEWDHMAHMVYRKDGVEHIALLAVVVRV